MSWMYQEVVRQLAPEVSRFVLLALYAMERENVFDAPSVIGGVLGQMRVADSDVIRSATGRTERVLKNALARGCMRRLGA